MVALTALALRASGTITRISRALSICLIDIVTASLRDILERGEPAFADLLLPARVSSVTTM
jgi:hypothetical protein